MYFYSNQFLTTSSGKVYSTRLSIINSIEYRVRKSMNRLKSGLLYETLLSFEKDLYIITDNRDLNILIQSYYKIIKRFKTNKIKELIEKKIILSYLSRSL